MTIDFSVFENIKYLSDEPISTMVGIEPCSVEAFFGGKARFDVTLRELNENYSHDPSACLGFMRPQAFAFFLPSFMKISLVDYHDADVIPDSVVYRIHDMGAGRAEDNLKSVMLSYAHEQIKRVLDFLCEMSEAEWKYHNPNLALMAHDSLQARFRLKGVVDAPGKHGRTVKTKRL